jgi:predicted ABC-type exoprotein transport system permease subunit
VNSYIIVSFMFDENDWILVFLLTRPSWFTVLYATEKLVTFCWRLFLFIAAFNCFIYKWQTIDELFFGKTYRCLLSAVRCMWA